MEPLGITSKYDKPSKFSQIIYYFILFFHVHSFHTKVYGFKHSLNFFKMQESLQKEIPNHNDPFQNHISEF
jgi:hypothetical protein